MHADARGDEFPDPSKVASSDGGTGPDTKGTSWSGLYTPTGNQMMSSSGVETGQVGQAQRELPAVLATHAVRAFDPAVRIEQLAGRVEVVLGQRRADRVSGARRGGGVGKLCRSRGRT